jgi:hypothetical protein
MAEGTTSIGKALHNLNVFLFEKNKKVMYVVALILIPALTFFVFNWEAKDKAPDMLGRKEINAIISGLGNGGIIDFSNTDDFVEMRGTISDSTFIGERSGESYTIANNQSKVVKGLEITITWEDETTKSRPSLRRYRNQPDTFSVMLVHPDGNTTSLGERDEGPIMDAFTFNETVMEEMYGKGDYTVIVTCISAGDWMPLFDPLGIWPPIADTGNNVDIQIQETYLAPPLDEE